MKKEELLSLIADKLDCTKKHAKELITELDLVIECIAEECETDTKTKLGEYIVVEKIAKDEAARRDPRDGKVITVPAHKLVRVKATKKLKDILK